MISHAVLTGHSCQCFSTVPRPSPANACRRAADIWWIQSVFVSPDFRRKGFYTAMYNHAKQEAKAAAAVGLRLYADKDNINAQATVGPCIASA